MSEAELHFIRAGLIGGQLCKARPGELQMGMPVGLVYDPAHKVVLDPDTGVQQAIRHVFTLFARTGSARATVQQFNADKLLFPVRVRTGTHKGQLAWMPLQHWRVLRTLHNPRYVCVHRSTIKNWIRAGILNSHTANDKDERLYQPPTPGDPRLTT
jgi:DNA invertase Pin-like site-specific DNA recombinase